MHKLMFCFMGPTASGKTALASELVKQYPFEIISVDSAMIYKTMNIGTAKPTAEELHLTPHHLIDIRDPTEAYSAAEFCADTAVLAESIQKRGKIPLLVGGTMMYFNALQKGLSSLPQADVSIRSQLEQEAALRGWETLHHQLMHIDPETAGRIHPHDAQRIQRALEVYRLTGRTLSQFLRQQKKDVSYQFVNFVLFPQNRSWLHARIALRFEHMLAQGFIDEVRQIKHKWNLTPNLPSTRCVGYRQALDYLNKHYEYPVMCDKAIAATRQLAKRQLTWLRRWDGGLFYDPQNEAFKEEIMAKVGEILDNSMKQ